MPGYAPAGEDGAFAQSREFYAETEEWLTSAEAAGLQHAELEEQLQDRGRELLRRLFQGHLDLLAAREVRRDDVTGEDRVARTRAEKGHGRALATVFGQVTVSRMAYRAPGAANVHPLDAALNLPEEKRSHGLRKMTAIEAARGSHQAAAAAVTREWAADEERSTWALQSALTGREFTSNSVLDAAWASYPWARAARDLPGSDPNASVWRCYLGQRPATRPRGTLIEQVGNDRGGPCG